MRGRSGSTSIAQRGLGSCGSRFMRVHGVGFRVQGVQGSLRRMRELLVMAVVAVSKRPELDMVVLGLAFLPAGCWRPHERQGGAAQMPRDGLENAQQVRDRELVGARGTEERARKAH